MQVQAREQPAHLARQADFAAFRDRLEACLAEAGAEGSVSLCVVDLDLFGTINKKHGRAVGDAVLETLAAYLRETFGADGEVMRCGGDAYAVVLNGVEKERAFILVEGARSGFDGKRIVEAGGEAVELTLSISAGVSAFPDDGNDTLALIRKANEALYRAKVSGRNKACLAREEKMVTKTVHYTQGQLHGLSRLAKREKMNEASLLREALDDLLRKYNA